MSRMTRWTTSSLLVLGFGVLLAASSHADVLRSHVVTNTNVVFEGTVDDSVAGQDNNLPVWLFPSLAFWSLRVTQDDFGCPGVPIVPGAFDDLRVEARHWVGPHGEAFPNPPQPGEILATICDVNPAAGTTASVQPVQVVVPHGGHQDVLQLRYDSIQGAPGSFASIRLAHAIEEDPGVFRVVPPPPDFPDDGILPPLDEPLDREVSVLEVPALGPMGLWILGLSLVALALWRLRGALAP